MADGYYPNEVTRAAVESSQASQKNPCEKNLINPDRTYRSIDAGPYGTLYDIPYGHSTQPCDTKAENPYLEYPYASAQADAKSDPPQLFDVSLTVSELQSIARNIPNLRPVLEASAPEAFSEVVNTVDILTEHWQRDVCPTQDGPYEGLGLDLPYHYQWEIVPGSFGLGSALVGRRRLL